MSSCCTPIRSTCYSCCLHKITEVTYVEDIFFLFVLIPFEAINNRTGT